MLRTFDESVGDSLVSIRVGIGNVGSYHDSIPQTEGATISPPAMFHMSMTPHGASAFATEHGHRLSREENPQVMSASVRFKAKAVKAGRRADLEPDF